MHENKELGRKEERRKLIEEMRKRGRGKPLFLIL